MTLIKSAIYRPLAIALLFAIMAMLTISCGGGGGGDGSSGGGGSSSGGDDNPATPGVSDTTPPTIIQVVPSNGSTSVATNSSVVAIFSEEMNSATVNTSTFRLYNGSIKVSGDVQYTGTTAIFTPSANLAASTQYTATVLYTVTDITGNEMVENYEWSFITGTKAEIVPPTVKATVPVDGVVDYPVNASVKIIFSEDMNPITLNSSTITLGTGGVNVAGAFDYTSATTVIFNPDADLAFATTYTATVTTGAKDIAGNALEEAYTWSFTTGSSADSTGPSVTSTVPADGATGFFVSYISATFDEPFDEGTVTPSTFFLLDATSADVPGSYMFAANSVSFTPTGGFDFNTSYTANITTGITDLSGNPGVAHSWSFATGVDSTKPTIPGNFGITSIDKASGTVSLSWEASTDNSQVAYYNIFRNNFTSPIATTTGTTYTNTGLADNVSYTYVVSAMDRYGNESDQSQQAVVSILDLDITPPTKPGNFTATGVSSSKIYLTWDASSDNGATLNYVLVRLYPSATFILDSGVRNYYDEPIAPSTGRSYQISACDNASPANCSQVAEAIGFTQASSVSSSHMTLPDTGQDSLAINDPAIFGDDADYWSLAYHPMSMTDNFNGTVIDNNTGLIWQQSDDDSAKSASEAAAYCSQLDLASYTVGTWRLPTKKELITIVNYGDTYTAPAINPEFSGIDGVLSSPGYWTSTEYASDAAKQWFINFYDGGLNVAGNTSAKYVLCVQGSRPAQSLTDNGDGTVTDNVTGLMWQQTPYNGSMDWYNAIDSCEGLALSVYDDWRLPNIKELESITDDTEPEVAINPGFFPNASALFYWTSTVYVPDYLNQSWRMAFGPDSINGTYDNGDGYVRCVRGYGY